MTLSVQGWGGINEIGGNKILLKDQHLRLLLDFGMSFSRQDVYFNDFLKPRSSRGIQDPLLLSILPPLEGIYRSGLETNALWEQLRRRSDYLNFARHNGSPLDAVLLSHAHLDHIGDLGYINENVPIYTTLQTGVVARTLQMMGNGGIGEDYTFVKARELDENGLLKIDRKGDVRARPIIFVDSNNPCAETEVFKKFWRGVLQSPLVAEEALYKDILPCEHNCSATEIRGHRLLAWEVDHSIPGSCAFAIETEKGWVVYTGDLRFVGSRQKETEHFVQEIARLKPYAVLCEGTHTENMKQISEEEIFNRALEIVRHYSQKIIFADFAFKNTDRFFTFLKLAEKTKRKLLVQPKALFLLWTLSLTDPKFAQCFTNPALALFDDPKASLRGWEKFIRELAQARTYDFQIIDQHPEQFIYMSGLNNINDLLDLTNINGGAYLYANSKAYDDEQKADLVRLRNWLAYFNLDLYGDPEDPKAVVLHTSGHASGGELASMIQEVQPKILVPIHTEHPEWWQEQVPNVTRVLYPQQNLPLILE